MIQDRMVVARFQDGRMIKGTTHDFFPNKPEFHVYEGGDEKRRAVPVPLAALKAVFFVKSYEGEKTHKPHLHAAEAKAQGRKVEVHFADGETLCGFTMGYNPSKPGFFVVPEDTESNNTRVYVVSAAVKEVRAL